MTSAYGVFAQEGVRHPETGILSVEDAQGNVLESYKDDPGSQVLDPNVAHTMDDMLADDNARIPEFGAHSALYVPGHTVAVKTGTTNDYRDTWIIGYTPSLAVGAWAGNNDNSAMEKKIAGFIVAPLWNEFMRYALASSTDEAFPPPSPEDPNLPPVFHGIWNEGGQIHEILNWVDKNNPLGPPPANPAGDGQYWAWEYPVSLWAGELYNGLISTSTDPSTVNYPPPVQTISGYNDGSLGGAAAMTSSAFGISYPSEGTSVQSGKLLTVTVTGSALSTSAKVSYFVNGVSIGSSTQAPFSISFIPSELGATVIRAVADGAGRYAAQVGITVQ